MKCGIYRIHDVKNDMWYVGQSRDVERRLNHHHYELRRGTHFNARLQAAYAVGGAQFVFECAEVCGFEQLNEREQCWVEQYHSNDPACGYNRALGGGIRESLVIPKGTYHREQLIAWVRMARERRKKRAKAKRELQKKVREGSWGTSLVLDQW